jgi:hypothetical protein
LTAKSFTGQTIPANRGRYEVIDFALQQACLAGLFLQFGVYQGESLKFIAERSDSYVFGFDSFEGLPEDWFFQHDTNEFNLGGQVPQIQTHRDNIRLIKGWFKDTLPAFEEKLDCEVISFIHMDADIYSSTKEVFDSLGHRIVAGTVIVFDEYFNYPGWQNHEHKAFMEFVKTRNLDFEYIAYAPRQYAVAVRIK